MNDQKISSKKWLSSNFFAIAAVVVAIANLWLFAKLAPLTLHVNQLDNKVLANENNLKTFGEDLKYIRGRVDDLYNLFIKP